LSFVFFSLAPKMRLPLFFLCCIVEIDAAAVSFFVDCERGNDAASGTSVSTPFASLMRARDAIRALNRPLSVGGVTVTVSAGTCYPLGNNYSAPVLLLDDAALDSGDANSPIVWSGAQGAAGATVLSAGVPIPMSAWHTDTARVGCFSAKLTDVPTYDASVGLGSLQAGPLGFCASGKAILARKFNLTTPARWPNMRNPLDSSSWAWLYAKNATNHSVTVNTTRPIEKAWPAGSAWLHGYWEYDWADSYVRIAGVEACGKDCTVINVDPRTVPTYTETAKCRVMGVDLIEELDAPGESFVDTSANSLHYCPIGGDIMSEQMHLTLGASVVVVSPATTTSAQSISFVSFSDFTLAHSRTAGFKVKGVTNSTFNHVSILGHGGMGADISGVNSTVTNLRLESIGCGGVTVGGGDEASLTPAATVLSNSVISDYGRISRTYHPGIAWYGVGLTVAYNEIHNGPHSAILGGGNDCEFRANYVHDVCYESTDSGAWYAGRSWVRRGNILVDNIFENVQVREAPELGYPAINCVYLDDELSGQFIINNTFRNCYNGMMLGGGRDNVISGNRFENLTNLGITFDARGLGWQKDFCHYDASNPMSSGELVTDLFSVHYQSPPYSTAYPQLPGLLADRPCTPVGNKISKNTYCRLKAGFIDTNATRAAAWGSIETDNSEVC